MISPSLLLGRSHNTQVYATANDGGVWLKLKILNVSKKLLRETSPEKPDAYL